MALPWTSLIGYCPEYWRGGRWFAIWFFPLRTRREIPSQIGGTPLSERFCSRSLADTGGITRREGTRAIPRHLPGDATGKIGARFSQTRSYCRRKDSAAE